MIHMQTGTPADAVRLGKDVDAMTKSYGAHGYMEASIQATPTMDDATGRVSYRVAIQEGEQYHMGELDIRGLDSRATDRLQLKWKLRPGDPYDSSYLSVFLDEAKGMLPGDWEISAHETPDANDKTVDITLRFDRKS
jgi:outer membrane protein assembly factor BamA